MAEVFKYALRVQGGIDAAAWWLVAAAAVLALVLFAAWLRRSRPFAPALAKFRQLKPLGKAAAICVFCALVWRGGAKNGGDRGGENPPAENAEFYFWYNCTITTAKEIP